MAWFETWFDTPYYHLLYKDRDFQEAEKFITLLADYLQLPTNSRVIDLACGKGRHSVFLNQLGFDVLGVDLSRASILHNKNFENQHLRFEIHDMRTALFPELISEKANGIFNLFTSFGYFDTEEEDLQVFRSVADALDSDGFFVLDFLNEKKVRNTLVKQETVVKGDVSFSIKRTIENDFVIKDIFFTDLGNTHHYQEKVKLHTLKQITDYGEKYGLKPVAVFGNYDLEEYNADCASRCIVIFKK